jgi:hypothetical protein
MFEIFCRSHGSRVLLDHSRIEALRTTPDGPVLDWRCWCGERGSLVRGRQAPVPERDRAPSSGPRPTPAAA